MTTAVNALLEVRVAPHAGAWIEIIISRMPFSVFDVAPHAGAWIEMFVSNIQICDELVAPHAGAWIEIFSVASASSLVGVAPMPPWYIPALSVPIH